MSEKVTAGTAHQQRAASSLHLRGLTVQTKSHVLLDNVDATMAAGKITVIVGASGAGKSVLLRTMAGLIPKHGNDLNWTGDVAIESSDRSDIATSKTGIIAHQPRIGIVFQQFALFDELSPIENVQFAIDHRTEAGSTVSRTATQWLEELKVPSKVRVSVLSGGQKQRLAIARTLAAQPDVVLYDEPSSGLDAATGQSVAKLIRQTHESFGRTSVVVTHDYETMLAIADEVLLLDSDAKTLVQVPAEQWNRIGERIQPTHFNQETISKERGSWVARDGFERSVRFLEYSGRVALATVRLPVDLFPRFPSVFWGLRFFLHYLRLVGGFSAWLYLLIAGLIAGFTTTYFTFRFLPFRLYTQPLLIDELLSSIGFALYRVLVPVLATILVAARCGAAVAADVGVKRYGGAMDALRTFGIRPKVYLLVPIVAAFMVATPFLEWIAFQSARLVSAISFTATHPEVGEYFWRQHFDRRLIDDSSVWPVGFGWVLLKNLACGVGSGVIGYYQGAAAKYSTADVSDAITGTVLWSTLYVLVVHFAVALMEF